VFPTSPQLAEKRGKKLLAVMSEPFDPGLNPTKSPPGGLTEEERTWGMLAHVSPFIAGLVALPFLGPLVIWLIYKEKSDFVSDQAKESLNFQIAVLIAAVVCGVTCILSPLIVVVAIGAIIYQIIAAMEANKGVRYRYPYTIRIIN
jgi:uncharacterized protein